VNLYQTVYEEQMEPDGIGGAIKRARKKLMLTPRWPLCKRCTTPYELTATMYGLRMVQVFVDCKECARGNYNVGKESEIVL
jgi:RNase P subunit RPR2